MPPNTVYVGRPTKWGNPYPEKKHGLEKSLDLYAAWLGEQIRNNPEFLYPLKGKNLACFCSLNKPCHADIILDLIGV